MSKPLQDYRGLTWIRKGSGLPAGTAAANFKKDDENIRKGKRVASASMLDTWFDGGGGVELNEDVGQCLTWRHYVQVKVPMEVIER